MKNKILLDFSAFCVAFLFGYIVVQCFSTNSTAEHPPAAPITMKLEQPELAVDSTRHTPIPEFTGLPEFGESGYFESSENLIDVREIEGLYRESEVIAKTGEPWLTLLERNGEYSLIRARAKVQKKKTISYPGDEHDVNLTFDKPGNPVFSIRNLEVRPGVVMTLFEKPSPSEMNRLDLPVDIGRMDEGFIRTFDLEGREYKLRVSTGLTEEGQLLGVLVLEFDGVKQVISQSYLDLKSGGTSLGTLLWVGDLDDDRKLDLYFDRGSEAGGYNIGLFISSESKPGKLVRNVANFGTGGC